MGWVDRVPRAGNLYIGGLYALYHPEYLKAEGITHVLSLSAPPLPTDPELVKGYTHLHVAIDDDPNEDLLRSFGPCCAWIERALKVPSNAVFVHCAMGKSRSAAVIVAYLMYRYRVSAVEGLAQLCEGRPVCSPNPGFWEQLEVWARILKEGNRAAKEIYEGWKVRRFVGEIWEWERRGASMGVGREKL